MDRKTIIGVGPENGPFGRVRDYHVTGKEHKKSSGEDPAIFYDDKFFDRGKMVAHEGGESKTEKPETGAGRVEDIRKKAGREVVDALKYQYIVPERIEKGAHLGRDLAGRGPVSVGLYANADIINKQNVAPGQIANIGVGGVKFNEESLNGRILEFNFRSEKDKTPIFEVITRALTRGGIKNLRIKPANVANELQLDIVLKKRLLNCNTTPMGPRCYIIRGKQVIEVSSGQNLQLESGDIVFAANRRLLEDLVKNITTMPWTEESSAYFDQEIPNQVYGMIMDSLMSTEDIEQFSDRQELSMSKLHENIEKVITKTEKKPAEKELVATSFIAYQVP